MLIKWITARAVDRAGFARGQAGWAGLRRWPGFVGQFGGWAFQRDACAHVFGAWSDDASYRAFMADGHDAIAAAQAGTYDAIEVRLFEHRLDIGAGLFAEPAGMIRLAHCHVVADRQAHFSRAQAEVWNPAMTAAPGMLGGAFARRFAHREGSEFLVLSRWRSAADHERYRTDDVPALRDRADAAADLTAVTGALIAVEPAWTV